MSSSLKEMYLESIRLGEINDSLEDLLDDVDKLSFLNVQDNCVEYTRADVEKMEHFYRDRCLKNIHEVEKLGKEIGYGAMMSYASALWRYSLIHEANLPPSGAFVPRCVETLSDEEKVFDDWVDVYKQKQTCVNTCTLDASKSAEVCFIIRNRKELADILFILADNKYSWAGISGPTASRKLGEGPIYLLINKSIKVAMCIEKRPRHVLSLYNAQDFNQESLGIAISNKLEAKGGE